MKVALISLPKIEPKIPNFSWIENLKGYWNPPEYVTEFWVNACYITFIDQKDYENKKNEIILSYIECHKDFFRIVAL